MNLQTNQNQHVQSWQNVPPVRQRGLTLMEILITVLILAVGLLGVASMQTQSLKGTANANNRSLAMYLANDITDRMRANRLATGNGKYNAIANASASPDCVSSVCTPDQLAARDLYEWKDNIERMLPSGTATISRSGNIFTITVGWIDKINAEASTSDSTKVSTAQSQVVVTHRYMPSS